VTVATEDMSRLIARQVKLAASVADAAGFSQTATWLISQASKPSPEAVRLSMQLLLGRSDDL